MMGLSSRPDKEKLSHDLTLIHQRFDRTADMLKERENGLTEQQRSETADSFVVLNTELQNIISELLLIQARARLESVLLEPIALDSRTALAIARSNRLDWMNNRAALVDSWRLIEYNANDLLSNLDITLSGDLGTQGNNPAKFQWSDRPSACGYRIRCSTDAVVGTKQFPATVDRLPADATPVDSI